MADFANSSKNITTWDNTIVTDTKHWSENIQSLSLRHGGQFGYLPMIGGKDNAGNPIHEWMYNQSYVRRDVIPVVLQTPRFFDLLPNSDTWHQMCKALIEVHAQTIEGLNSSLTVEAAEREAGLEGAAFEEPTNVTREQTKISITVQERYGIPVEIFLDTWIRYGIMDPDTKAPLVSTLKGAEGIDVYTHEWYTMTVLFIEPDILNRRAIHAWLVSNMFPHGNPDIIGKREKKAAKETKDITIEFGGFALPTTNVRVMEMANRVLNNLSLYTKTPDDILLPATDVASSLVGKGQGLDIYFEETGNSSYNKKNESNYEANKVEKPTEND